MSVESAGVFGCQSGEGGSSVVSIDSGLLYQPKFSSAVANIQRRAERQTDVRKLEDIFVTSDLMIRAEVTDTQLILGRRGTGKTHMIRVFQLRKQQAGQLVYYFDCTRLGSGY